MRPPGHDHLALAVGVVFGIHAPRFFAQAERIAPGRWQITLMVDGDAEGAVSLTFRSECGNGHPSPAWRSLLDTVAALRWKLKLQRIRAWVHEAHAGGPFVTSVAVKNKY
jgi:hypothetical protein